MPRWSRASLFLVFVAALVATASSAGSTSVGAVTTVPRWFSSKSPFNKPIKRGAAVDPGSAAMIASILSEVRRFGWPISVKRWSVPVYFADRSARVQTVDLTAYWAPARTLSGVPVPDNAQPDPAGDGHMAIIDRDSGCFYEFYRAARAQDGTLSAGWANRGLMSGKGIQPGGWSTRDSGFVNFAGLIRPEELRAGAIRHALTFSTMYSLKGPPVAPATASGGSPLAPPDGTMALPYGAHLQLDPNLDLNALGLTQWQKVVARALQVYGMYLADTGGFGIGAVNPQGYVSNPYADFWGDFDYAYLPDSLAEHLRVLKLGPLHRPRAFLVKKSRCGFER